jgi:hypothetical protein
MPFSRNWLEQSEDAQKEGVCHTEDECKQMYSEIPQYKKDAAIDAFRNDKTFAADFQKIRDEIAADPEHWNVPYHLWWGMGVRNFFRQKYFGEEYFGIDNMDCIYKFLVVDAVTK